MSEKYWDSHNRQHGTAVRYGVEGHHPWILHSLFGFIVHHTFFMVGNSLTFLQRQRSKRLLHILLQMAMLEERTLSAQQGQSHHGSSQRSSDVLCTVDRHVNAVTSRIHWRITNIAKIEFPFATVSNYHCSHCV